MISGIKTFQKSDTSKENWVTNKTYKNLINQRQ